jgi:hypothetical protein
VGELLYKGANLGAQASIYDLTSAPEGAYDLAEPHFLAAGKRDSGRLLGEMMARWAGTETAPGAFALRGTIP